MLKERLSGNLICTMHARVSTKRVGEKQPVNHIALAENIAMEKVRGRGTVH